MKKMLICQILQESQSYPIEIHHGLLKNVSLIADTLKRLGNQYALISDDRVMSLYGEQFCEDLKIRGIFCKTFIFPNGEKNKNRFIKESIENSMLENGLGKDTCLIALGGGVVTDLAGFLASTYCRGISLVLIPTTLLGMVDAAIGGKTGLNTPIGKNLIGTVYQPKAVWIDPIVIETLSKADLQEGIVEMIKHGLILDKEYFEFLENNVSRIFSLNADTVFEAISKSCSIKMKIVEQDVNDRNKRHLLNFGHTLGHAIEILSKHSVSHGKAVAIGICVESYLSYKMKFLSKDSFQKIINIFKYYEISLKIPCDFSFQDLLKAVKIDKKSIEGQPRFILLNEIGSTFCTDGSYSIPVEISEFENAFQWMKDDLCRD